MGAARLGIHLGFGSPIRQSDLETWQSDLETSEMSEAKTQEPRLDPQLHKMKPMSGVDAIDLLMTARTRLFMTKKFFGRLAMRLQFIQSYKIPTAAIDVRGRFYYNPYFINNLRLTDCIFVVAHEVFHLVQRTHSRFPKGGLHRFWNEASDISNNQSLQKAGIEPREELQKILCGYDEDSQKYQDQVSEFIYYDLIANAKDATECEACRMIAEGILNEHHNRTTAENSQKGDEDDKGEGNGTEDGDEGKAGNEGGCGCGDGCGDGHACGDHGDMPGQGNSESDQGGKEDRPDAFNDLPEHTCKCKGCASGVTSDQTQGGMPGDAKEWNKWQRGILSAAEGLGRGELPGAVQKMLDDLKKPSVSWKDVLRTVASAIFGKGRYTFRRPSRRSLSTGVRMPSRLPEALGALLWLDSSGSIGPETLRQFASEALGILEQCGCSTILVGCHDVNAYFLTEVSSARDLLNIPFRTGGTSHVDVFDIVNGKKGAEGIELPKGYKVGMVVCMTDMMSEFPQSCKYDVIWGVPSQYFHSKNRWGNGAPFGKEVEVTV
jgi:predicted metal-dependent peptidase